MIREGCLCRGKYLVVIIHEPCRDAVTPNHVSRGLQCNWLLLQWNGKEVICGLIKV